MGRSPRLATCVSQLLTPPCPHNAFARHSSGSRRKRRPISDRVQLTFGMFLQLGGFLIFWLLPAANRKQLWKFAVASVTFVVGLPFVYVAPALQAKLTTQRTQGRGQGVRRSAVSLAQVVGPLWSSLADVPVRFWGGMVGFTGLGILIIAAAWR